MSLAAARSDRQRPLQSAVRRWDPPGRADSEPALRAWYKNVLSFDWRNWGDVKRDYPHASIVGDCVVFNVGGNKYRVVTRIRYRSHRVYILKVMTHAEYDQLAWVVECGCHEPPPSAKAAPARENRKGKQS